MKCNISTVDRLLRIIAGVLLGILFVSGLLSGALAIIILVLSIIMLATGLLKFCLVYAIFGISTSKEDDAEGE